MPVTHPCARLPESIRDARWIPHARAAGLNVDRRESAEFLQIGSPRHGRLIASRDHSACGGTVLRSSGGRDLRHDGGPPPGWSAARAAVIANDERRHLCLLAEAPMPVADYGQSCEMLERARKGRFAYPAINVTSLTSANAVLRGLAESGSDGIIQVSTGGGEHASGTGVKDMVLGAICLANHVHLVARYNINIALHTDHCQPKKVDTFLKPLIAETERRRAKGEKNLFNSHMFDGSELPLDANMRSPAN